MYQYSLPVRKTALVQDTGVWATDVGNSVPDTSFLHISSPYTSFVDTRLSETVVSLTLAFPNSV